MPTLPDVPDLGARPIPTSRRSIASNPRAGAVGDAAARLGDRMAQLGERGLQQAREREDKLSYASARSALLRADIETRRELAEDPDFDTWEARYGEKMRGALGAAAQGIASSADRALFQQEADLDILRGSAELATGAHARRVDREIGSAREQLFEMQDLAQNAPDDASREAVIGNANDLIGGLQSKGYLKAEEAGNLRREWTQNYVVQRIESLRNVEDYDGAQRFFEANRGRLDSATESRVANLLTDAAQNREALILGEQYYQSGGLPTVEPGQEARPHSANGWASVATSVANEFGLDPVEVASVISYETGGTFSPTIMGGRGGNYMGLIQFGPEERRKYGITANSTPEQWSAAINGFLRDRGFKRGMGVIDLYSTINAGQPGRYNASDGYGTVASHTTRLLSQHRASAEKWLNEGGFAPGQGTAGPQRRDLRQINAAIDADAEAQGWSPEKTERVKAQAAKLVSRDDTLLERDQADAYDAALARAEALGDSFTDPSQLGEAYYKASETQQKTLRNMAEANVAAQRAAATPKGDGDIVRALHRMQIDAPGQFANVDLRPYRPFMTPGEYDEVSTAQAKAKTEAGQWSPRTGIQNAITWGEKFGGVELDDDEHRFRVYRYMEDRAGQFRTESQGRTPAESDYQRWFREATGEINVRESFLGFDALNGDDTVRAYDDPTVASSAYRKQIIRNFRAVNGRDPNEAEIQQWYARMGEAIR